MSALIALAVGIAADAAQVPAAPAGGLDASRLPDVMGVHLGMTVAQAVAVVKAKYPTTTLFYAKFRNAHDTPWVARMNGKIAGTGTNAASTTDEITVFFTAPPNTQVVVRIDRSVMMPMTTTGNVVASLVQKYGPSLVQKTIHANLSWEFDEEGHGTSVPGPYICTSFYQPAPAMPEGQQPGELLFGGNFGAPIDTQISKLVSACPDKIVLTTLLDPSPASANHMVSSLTVSLIDHAEDFRAFYATSKYGEAAAAASDNAAQKALEKNAAPKL